MNKKIKHNIKNVHTNFLHPNKKEGAVYLNQKTFLVQEEKNEPIDQFHPLTKESFCVIDLETTGPNKRLDHLIEITIYKYQKQKLIDSFHCLVQSNKPLKHDLIALTGITRERLEKEGLKINYVLRQLKQMIQNSVLILHNGINFGLPFLNQSLTLNGLAPINNVLIDTLRLSQFIYPKNNHHKLIDLCQRLNVDYQLTNFERTKQKVAILTKIFLKLINLHPNLINNMIQRDKKQLFSQQEVKTNDFQPEEKNDDLDFQTKLEQQKTEWILKYQNDEAITNKEDSKNEPKSPQKTASELIEDLKMKAESAVKNNKDQPKSPKNSETTPSHDANKVLKDLKKTESDFQKLKNEWEAKIKKLENDLTEQKIESQLQLKKQETKFNELYLEKMKEKAQKADQIIKAKTAELETKFNEKLQELKKYGLEKTGGELVDIISKFEMVISQEPDDPKLKNYFQGFVMFKSLFDHFLTRNKIHKTEIQVGDQFDPGIMEAFENVTVYDPKQDHKVLKVLNPCYKLHDRVIKYALVEVGNYQPKTDQE